eukprot:1444320-Amphidinium_carterae.2
MLQKLKLLEKTLVDASFSLAEGKTSNDWLEQYIEDADEILLLLGMMHSTRSWYRYKKLCISAELPLAERFTAAQSVCSSAVPYLGPTGRIGKPTIKTARGS